MAVERIGGKIRSMGAIDYELVFDAADGEAPWPPIAFCLLFVGIGVLLVWSSRIEPPPRAWRGWFRTNPTLRKGYALFWLCGSSLATMAAAVGILGSHWDLQRAIREGRTSVVEGRVQEFHPMPYSGHDTERFVVGDVHFAYSDWVVSSAFSHSSSHGGPIREGLQVRIHYVVRDDKAEIVQLEVEK
jgi:hypothetical protein